jgi:hypothetical protein
MQQVGRILGDEALVAARDRRRGHDLTSNVAGGVGKGSPVPGDSAPCRRQGLLDSTDSRHPGAASGGCPASAGRLRLLCAGLRGDANVAPAVNHDIANRLATSSIVIGAGRAFSLLDIPLLFGRRAVRQSILSPLPEPRPRHPVPHPAAALYTSLR